MARDYVVVGSGIIGLYTCYSLLERGVAAKSIHVVAQHLPGDTSRLYTSPWAGGNFSCISPDDEETLKYDKYTYMNLHRIAKSLGAGCGLAKLPTTEFWDMRPSAVKIASLSSYLEDFQILLLTQLEGRAFGVRYTTWNFNCPLFLMKFKEHLQGYGVSFERRQLESLSDLPCAKVVFNCSGIGAHALVGDTKVYPVRGQVVVAEAPHIRENRMRWGSDYATYIIPRPDSDELILGGFIQKDNWSGDTFQDETEDILHRTSELFPATTGLKILKVASGLRPYREGGVRIEKETRGSTVIVHNYGAGGYGYQSGWGMANFATSLLKNESKI